MSEHAFLSDRRQQIVDGATPEEMEIESGTYRHHRSQTKHQSEQALQELIEVAESPVIDTRDVFDPDDVFRLLSALFTPDEYTGTVYPSSDAPDDWLQYHDRLYVQLDKLMHPYRDGRFIESENE